MPILEPLKEDYPHELEDFFGYVADQFMYGGKKYSSSTKKEATDILFDIYGKNWLLGTINKYTYRYSNLKRSRDLFKIGTYMYLIWLKRGYFIMESGVQTPIDTNIEIKEHYFPKFKKEVIDHLESFEDNSYSECGRMEVVSKKLTEMAKSEYFTTITDYSIKDIFCYIFLEWKDNFSQEKNQDTDTWNEEKERK